MTLNEYTERMLETLLPSSDNAVYAVNGLTAEVGEINDKIAKWVRKGFLVIDENNAYFSEEGVESGINFPEELAYEVGDVLYFVALLSRRIGYSLEDVAKMNTEKLASRKKRGVIIGNGDQR